MPLKLLPQKIELMEIKRLIILLILVNFITQTFTAVTLSFNQNIFKQDLYSISYAKNFLETGIPYFEWRNDIGTEPYSSLHQNKFYFWRPIGYSIVLLFPLLIDQTNQTLLILYQVVIFSLLIPLIFVALLHLLKFLEIKNSKFHSAILTLIFILNPSYQIAPLQIDDKWFFSFLIALYFISLIGFVKSNKIAGLIFPFILFLLFRPIFIIPSLITLFLSLFFLRLNKFKFIKVSVTLLIVFILFALSSSLLFNKLVFGYSNAGYNFFLGNNNFFKDYFLANYGDCGSVEYDLLTKFEDEFNQLKFNDEFTQDEYLFRKGLAYIMQNPMDFVINSTIKFVNFFLSISLREGDDKLGKFKFIVSTVYYLPIIIAFLIAFFNKSIWKEEIVRAILIFIIITAFVYSFFFTFQKFRQPLEFLLLFIGYLNLILLKTNRTTN